MFKSESQKELLDILQMVKMGEINISDAELLFAAWNQQYSGGQTQSFKEKRVCVHSGQIYRYYPNMKRTATQDAPLFLGRARRSRDGLVWSHARVVVVDRPTTTSHMADPSSLG